MYTATFRFGTLLALAALGVSAATAQTDFPFAAGVDSTGRAQAQSNTDGQVLIESPQYPRGLWLHLVDEAGDALAGIQVEYQGRPDGLVVLRCVDPATGVQETLVWTRPRGDSLRLVLKPREAADLPAGLASIDWRIDWIAGALLDPVNETRLIGWEAVAAFLRARWQDQAGRVAVQLDASISFTVELDRPEAIEMLVMHLQQQAGTSLILLKAQVFKGELAILEGAILSPFFFEDGTLETKVRRALGRPQGFITLQEAASLTRLGDDIGIVHSLAGLEYFTALQQLSLAAHRIVDASPLTDLTNLTELNIGNNQIADLTPLANLTSLQVLDLWWNQIIDVSPLADLANLQRLDLHENQIADLTPLANLTNLTELNLRANQVADVSPLASLTNLTELNLSHNQITDVSPLANLTNLQWLDLSDKQIADLTPLANLTNLTELSLSYNQIADVGPLANLTNLQVLRLGRNSISDVSPLANLTNLTELHLNENQIVDVGPLANLTNLQGLDLFGNQIQDLTPLVTKTALGEGDSVNLRNNPLSDQARTEHIPALRARGVHVHL